MSGLVSFKMIHIYISYIFLLFFLEIIQNCGMLSRYLLRRTKLHIDMPLSFDLLLNFRLFNRSTQNYDEFLDKKFEIFALQFFSKHMFSPNKFNGEFRSSKGGTLKNFKKSKIFENFRFSQKCPKSVQRVPKVYQMHRKVVFRWF